MGLEGQPTFAEEWSQWQRRRRREIAAVSPGGSAPAAVPMETITSQHSMTIISISHVLSVCRLLLVYESK